MILYSVDIHSAINFILAYHYYRAYGRIHDFDAGLTNYREMLEEIQKEEVLNLALIPSAKINENFIQRTFTGYGLSGPPAIEVIKKKSSDYISILFDPDTDSYRLHMSYRDRRKSSIRTGKNNREKIRMIIEYLYKSSLLEANEDNYRYFWEPPMRNLKNNKAVYYIPEFTELLLLEDLQILMALLSCMGLGNMEMHNGLTGMHLLPAAELKTNRYSNLHPYSLLIELGDEFLYRLFR